MLFVGQSKLVHKIEDKLDQILELYKYLALKLPM